VHFWSASLWDYAGHTKNSHPHFYFYFIFFFFFFFDRQTSCRKLRGLFSLSQCCPRSLQISSSAGGDPARLSLYHSPSRTRVAAEPLAFSVSLVQFGSNMVKVGQVGLSVSVSICFLSLGLSVCQPISSSVVLSLSLSVDCQLIIHSVVSCLSVSMKLVMSCEV